MTAKEEPKKEQTSDAPNFVNREKLPESLAYTLDYIVGQVGSLIPV